MNQAAKLRFMTGGGHRVPLVVRTQFGVGRSSGSQHSQSLEALLAHVPGPSRRHARHRRPTCTACCGRRSTYPRPVVVIENRLLYERKGPHPAGGAPRLRSDEAHVGPPGHATSRSSRCLAPCRRRWTPPRPRPGRASTRGHRPAHHRPAGHGHRALVPRRTSRLLVVSEGGADFGVGAEIAARAVNEGFWSLDAPVRRLQGLPHPGPVQSAAGTRMASLGPAGLGRGPRAMPGPMMSRSGPAASEASCHR